MESIQMTHSLKPNLSQLLMRTIEQLEDPKYATVPQTHWDDFRPSILAKYHCEGGQDKDSYYERTSSKDDVCQQCLTPTTTESSNQRSTNVLTFRGMVWKNHPLWRYCASKIQMQLESSSKHVISTVKAKRKSVTIQSPQTSTIGTSTSYEDETKSYLMEEQKTKWRSQSFDQLLLDEKQEKSKNLHDHCSTAAFELLPPLFENRTHSLLYQNSYLLDGVKYDYDTAKPQNQRCVGTKLRLNYLKFLKSVNKTEKPSDRDIIFGEAKVVTNPPPSWESSRIDWLLNLERKQEMRKQQRQQQILNEKVKTTKLSKKEFEKSSKKDKAKDKKAKALKQPKLSENAPCKPEPTVKPRPSTKKGNHKNFFLRKSKKLLECKTKTKNIA